jgi:hypothetical protein
VVYACARFFGEKIWDVLDQGAGAEDVKALQSVADAEDGFAVAVGICEEEFVDVLAGDVCGGGLRGEWSVEFCGIDVGFAAGEQDGIAGGDEFLYFCFRLIEGDADWLAACLGHGFFVLRDGALGVFAVGGVREGDGDAGHGGILAFLGTGTGAGIPRRLLGRWGARFACFDGRGARHHMGRGGFTIFLADAFDGGEGSGLAVVADLHYQGENENYGAGYCGYGRGDVAVGDAHVGMDAVQFGGDDRAEDGEEQSHGEAEQGSDEGGEENANGNGVPARGAWGRHRCQRDSTRIVWRKFAT